jgi:hypothetical protein
MLKRKRVSPSGPEFGSIFGSVSNPQIVIKRTYDDTLYGSHYHREDFETYLKRFQTDVIMDGIHVAYQIPFDMTKFIHKFVAGTINNVQETLEAEYQNTIPLTTTAERVARLKNRRLR